MATFRSSVLVALIFASLACARASGTPEGAAMTLPGPEPTLIAQQTIEHVSPKRDSVGPAPARFEWTAINNAESYLFELHNEISLVASSKGIVGTSLDWPEEQRLIPGTYFWMVSAVREGHSIAGSGRSAFVVSE